MINVRHVQRDPQLIARIVEMRDAGMTRSQARNTLNMGEWKFRTIVNGHGIGGWTRNTPEVRAKSGDRVRAMNVEARAKAVWVSRMLRKMTPEERAMYRELRTRKPISAGLSVARAFEAVLNARREAA